MAGDLQYPATGLESFALPDMANIWNAITGGNPNFLPVERPRVYELTGTFNGGFNQLFFDCSAIYADYTASDQLLLTIESLNLHIDGPLLAPPDPPRLNYALAGSWATGMPMMEIPNSTGLTIRMALNQGTPFISQVGPTVANHSLNGPMQIAPFVKFVNITDPTITFTLTAGATFNLVIPGLPFYVLTVKVEKVS